MRILSFSFILLLLCQGCIAPKANIHSGKVTPKGNFTIGYDLSINSPFNTIGAASSQIIKEYKRVTDANYVYSVNTLDEYSKVLLAQAIDPIGTANQFYVRYGLIDQFDFGVAYGSAGLIYDAAYQFLNAATHTLDLSLGLQYSSQDYELPSVAGKVQGLLGFDFSRNDLLLRTTASLPFGENEKYGALGFGLALNYAHISYGFTPVGVKYLEFDAGDVSVLSGVPEDSEYFFSYGGFVNLKLGYQYVYFVSSLNLYHQDYGTYNIPNQKTVAYDGWTLVPSFGVLGTF